VAKSARNIQALRLITETLWMQHTVQLYEIVNP
jgi:hypothetical protein